MAQTESQVVGLELERVDPMVPTLFDRDGTFFRELEKGAVEVVSNRAMRVPLELRPGGNFGHFSADNADMGRGDGSTYDKATMSPVFLKEGFEFTTLTQWVTDDKRKAVLNSFRKLVANGLKEFRRNVDSLCMTDGTGVLATITSFSQAGNVDTYVLSTDGFRARLLRYGLTVDIYSSDLNTCRTSGTGVKISFYDLAGQTIKVPNASAFSPSNGDLIVVGGLGGATPPVSLFGVKYHDNSASTGTWLGFDRSITPEIRASRVNANSAALTLPLPRLAMNKAGDRIGENNVGKLQAWTHPAQAQAYEQLGFLVTELNQTGNGKGLDLYFGGPMRLAGAELKKHFSWDRTRIDFIDKSNVKRGVLKEAGFYETEGRRFYEVRGSSGGVQTSNIFYLVTAFNIFMHNPAGATYIDNLKIPSGY